MLTELNLSKCGINAPALTILCGCVQDWESSRLQSLLLAQNPLTEHSWIPCSYPWHAETRQRGLSDKDLYARKSEGLTALWAVLQYTTELAELDLTETELTSKHLKAFEASFNAWTQFSDSSKPGPWVTINVSGNIDLRDDKVRHEVALAVGCEFFWQEEATKKRKPRPAQRLIDEAIATAAKAKQARVVRNLAAARGTAPVLKLPDLEVAATECPDVDQGPQAEAVLQSQDSHTGWTEMVTAAYYGDDMQIQTLIEKQSTTDVNEFVNEFCGLEPQTLAQLRSTNSNKSNSGGMSGLDAGPKQFGRINPLLIAAQRGHQSTVALLVRPGEAKAHLEVAHPCSCLRDSSADDDKPARQTAYAQERAGMQPDRLAAGLMQPVVEYATPLVFAMCASSGPNGIDIAQTLIEANADLELRSTYQHSHHRRTALMYAVLFNSCDLVQLLLENGANVNAQDQTQRSALWMAVQAGYVEVVDKLLEYGATPLTQPQLQDAYDTEFERQPEPDDSDAETDLAESASFFEGEGVDRNAQQAQTLLVGAAQVRPMYGEADPTFGEADPSFVAARHARPKSAELAGLVRPGSLAMAGVWRTAE